MSAVDISARTGFANTWRAIRDPMGIQTEASRTQIVRRKTTGEASVVFPGRAYPLEKSCTYIRGTQPSRLVSLLRSESHLITSK